MKVTVISGSHRNDAQSLKIAKHIGATIDTKEIFDEQFLCDLGGNALPNRSFARTCK